MSMVAVAISGCSVKSFDSGRPTAAPAERVTAVHAVFAEAPDSKIERVASATDLISLAASASIKRKVETRATEDHALFVKTFTQDFKDKLPQDASKYGLTVSDSAPTEFRVVLGDQKTTCSLYGCVSSFDLRGDLLDASGKSIWHVTTTIGQSNITANIPDLFETFATEVLTAMKKDGVIGS